MLKLVLAALVLPFTASAADDCVPLATVSAQIRQCSQNPLAVAHAKACAQSVHESWKRASEQTVKRLAELQQGMKDRQQHQMSTSESSYQRVAEDLYREITQMQKYSALIASYGEAMMDFAEVNEEEPSADCFTENFPQLQPIVNGLDKEIIQAKAVYQQALSLRDATDKASVGFDGAKSAPGAAPAKGAPAMPKTGNPGNRDSDVTGIKEDAQKRAKQPAK